jgi:hypothetical protein
MMKDPADRIRDLEDHCEALSHAIEESASRCASLS